MSDNPATQELDNPATAASGGGVGGGATDGSTPPSFSWRNNLKTELRDSPMFRTFDDSAEGLNKAFESHANLNKLLGHEKVPIPKDDNDAEGWARFSKAMGVPDKAEGYGLADPQLPDALKGMGVDKGKFSEIAHGIKLTPSQTKALWKVYNDINVENYNKHLEGLKADLNNTINSLRGEWGDAYNTNVELGQMVINKFTEGNKEANDFITAALTKSAAGIKFLAKIGEQFAENKIGEFQAKKFTFAPEQAQEEIDKIMRDPKHPYNDINAPKAAHDRAVDLVNSLYDSILRAKGQS